MLHESLLGLAENGSPGHTTHLLEEVERAVDAAGGWTGIELIAVGLGPGSFTGLRVGVATAKALAAARGLQLRGVCTLDALARGLAEHEAAQRDEDAAGRLEAPGGASSVERKEPPVRPLLAALDARRGEAFAALYKSDGERFWGPWVGCPEELAERVSGLAESPLAGGSGAVRFRDELASRGVDIPDGSAVLHRVAARHVCALAEGAAGAGGEPVSPIYLRVPDAERWRERDTSQGAE